MAVVDKVQVGGTTYDVQDAKVAPLDARVNLLHGLVNYDYDTMYNGTVGANTLNGVRIGTRLTLNGTVNSGNASGRILLSGTIAGAWVTTDIDNLYASSTGIKLVDGHRYRLYVHYVSGTQTTSSLADISAPAPYIRDLNTNGAPGTSTTLPNGDKCLDFVYTAGDPEDKGVLIMLSRTHTNGLIFANYTLDILLYDLSVGGVIDVSGATPEIVAMPDTRYVCTAAYVESLAFTPSPYGISSVRFTSGTTPTVLTMPNTVVMPDWWTGVAANTAYDIRVRDGVYADVEAWPASAQALSQPVARYLGVQTGTVTAVSQSYVDSSIAAESRLYLYPFGLAVLKLFMAVKSAIPTDGVAINVAKVSVAPIAVITQTLSNPFGEGNVAMQIDTSGNLKVSTRGTSKPSGSWGIYETVICYPIAPYVAT